MPDDQRQDELVRAATLAAEIGVCERTLAYWRAKGIGPDWIRLGERVVAYPRSSIREWLAAQHRRSA